MKSLKVALSVALMGMAFGASAGNHSNDALSNSKFSVGAAKLDVGLVDATGFALEAGKQWHNGFYVNAQYMSVSDEVFGNDIDFTSFSGVVGKQFNLNDMSVFELEAGAVKAEAEAGSTKISDTNFLVAANYKVEVSNGWQLAAGLEHIDSNTSFVLGTEYMFTDAVGVSFEYKKDSDANLMLLQGTYRF
ncbi:MAG: hypothetical protein HAW67_01355 [Endozoicomonadaceae bacterium]|nr:hypothetical protein [Endozoicomonadaceae bacterium]